MSRFSACLRWLIVDGQSIYMYLSAGSSRKRKEISDRESPKLYVIYVHCVQLGSGGWVALHTQHNILTHPPPTTCTFVISMSHSIEREGIITTTKMAKCANDLLFTHVVALATTHISPVDRRAVMEINHDAYYIACTFMTHGVLVRAAKNNPAARSLRNLRPALVRYANLKHLEITLDYREHNSEHNSECDKCKAIESELHAILLCAEQTADLLHKKGMHLTVRFRPPPRAVVLRRACEKVTQSAGLTLARSSSVRALDLSHNNLRDEGTAQLAGALRNNHWLTALNLSGNFIDGRQNFRHAGSVALAEAVGTMRALVRLDLSQNRIATKEAGHALGLVLSHHTSLKELDLSNNANCDGADFAQGIADGMKKNTTLTSLHLGGNRISNAAMNELVAIVVDTKPAMQVLCAVPFRDDTLAKLDVSGQRLSAEGALVVARYLEWNGTVETLTFGDYNAVTMTTRMTEADFRARSFVVAEPIILAAFLPKCQ